MSYLPRKEWTIKNAPLAMAAAKGTGIFPETLLAMAIVKGAFFIVHSLRGK